MRRIKRKTFVLVIVPILLVLLGGGVLLAQRMGNTEIGNLQIFKGSASIVRSSQSLGGFTGTPVEVKDHIKAANNSIVALVLKDNSIVRLEAGSEVEVAAVSYQGGKLKDAEFNLISGRMWSRVQKLQTGSNFDVETPTVTAAVRGTSFNTTFKNKITGIYVYHHIVQVTLSSTGGKKNVNQTQLLQMQQKSLKSDFSHGPDLPPAGFFDDWIKFNQAQDDLLCKKLHDIPGDCGESVPSITKGDISVIQTTPKVAGENITAPTTNTTTTTPRKIIPKTGTTPTPIPVTLQSISMACTLVSSNIFTHYVPPTWHCTSTPHFSDGSTGPNVTSQTVWAVAYAAYGTISSGGVYTYINTCYANTVTGTYQGKQASFSIPAAQNGLF